MGHWWQQGEEPAERPGVPAADPYPATEPVIDPVIAALLADLGELRLTLAADLAAAAAAVDAQADRVAADIIDADRREVGDLLRRQRRRLAKATLDRRSLVEAGAGASAPSPSTGHGSRRRRLLIAVPAVPLAGALAVSAAAAMGFSPSIGSPEHRAGGSHTSPAPTTTPLTSTFDEFVTVLDGNPSKSQLVAAAALLHRQVAAALASGAVDATGVREVVHLLQMEQALLLRRPVPGADIVLAASRRLAQRLRDVLPQPSSTATPKSTTTRSHSPAVWPTPTSTPTATSVPQSPQPTHSSYSWDPSKTSPQPTPTSTATPQTTTAPSAPTAQIVSLGD